MGESDKTVITGKSALGSINLCVATAPNIKVTVLQELYD
jgi:hypothetical protein